MKEDKERKEKAVSLVRKHFKPGSILHRHLQCYRSLYENQDMNKQTCEKILKEAKQAIRLLDSEGLFDSQTNLIKDVNKELEPRVFSNFVPNYKSLATIDQIFSGKLSPKNIVILESQIVDDMSKPINSEKNTESIDNLVITSFVNKFNNKYENNLMENQKTLLNYYISSFADNGLGLKMFLNEEISRLKTQMTIASEISEIKSDKEMIDKTQKVFEKLDQFKSETIGNGVVLTILKTQQLEREIFENGD